MKGELLLQIYTIIHTAISLVAILTGFVVLFGLLSGKRFDGWTKWFLIAAVATTITGFFFPFHGFTPAIGLGIISLPFLAVTIFARYPKQLAGPWRWIYVIGAVTCLYFNLFVAVVQSFEKSSGVARTGPDANRTAIQIYPTCCFGDFRFARTPCGDPFSAGTGARDTCANLLSTGNGCFHARPLRASCNRPSSNGGETARHRSHCGAHIGSL